MKTFRVIIALLAVLPLSVLAHEGHGHEHPLSPGHYLGNPEHAIPISLAFAAVTVFIISRVRAARKARKP
jgi:hypothetical protein